MRKTNHSPFTHTPQKLYVYTLLIHMYSYLQIFVVWSTYPPVCFEILHKIITFYLMRF